MSGCCIAAHAVPVRTPPGALCTPLPRVQHPCTHQAAPASSCAPGATGCMPLPQLGRTRTTGLPTAASSQAPGSPVPKIKPSVVRAGATDAEAACSKSAIRANVRSPLRAAARPAGAHTPANGPRVLSRAAASQRAWCCETHWPWPAVCSCCSAALCPDLKIDVHPAPSAVISRQHWCGWLLFAFTDRYCACRACVGTGGDWRAAASLSGGSAPHSVGGAPTANPRPRPPSPAQIAVTSAPVSLR